MGTSSVRQRVALWLGEDALEVLFGLRRAVRSARCVMLRRRRRAAFAAPVASLGGSEVGVAPVGASWVYVEAGAGLPATAAIEAHRVEVLAALDAAGVVVTELARAPHEGARLSLAAKDRAAVWEALRGAASGSLQVEGAGFGPVLAAAAGPAPPPESDGASRWTVFRAYGQGAGDTIRAHHRGCRLEFDAAPSASMASEEAPPAPSFPIDVVYTWVDDGDPVWRSRRDLALSTGGVISGDGAVATRFTNRDELRYSLRSLHQYAPWVRHIHLVTDGQHPDWLDPDAAGITVVDHREIFRDPSVLPVFNSHAIESQLHHIPGLAERYVYFNDDVLLGRPVAPALFFDPSGRPRCFPGTAVVPEGPVESGEESVTSAARNGRDLMAAEFGFAVTTKFLHMPHAQSRALLEEMEGRWPDRFAEVAASRFRSPRDLSVAASLHHHVGLATGRVVPVVDGFGYYYLNLAANNLPDRFEMLVASNDYDVWCLNDTDVAGGRAAMVDRFVTRFLAHALPVPAPWELPGAR